MEAKQEEHCARVATAAVSLAIAVREVHIAVRAARAVLAHLEPVGGVAEILETQCAQEVPAAVSMAIVVREVHIAERAAKVSAHQLHQLRLRLQVHAEAALQELYLKPNTTTSFLIGMLSTHTRI